MTATPASTPPAPATPTTTLPARPRRWLRRLLWTAGGLLGLLALLVGLLHWWLPEWIRPRVEAAATEALGTPVQLQRIEFTPWRLDLRLHGLRVGPAEAPLAELEGAELQLSAETFWRRAPVVQRLHLIRPSLWLHRMTAEQSNFSALLEHLRARQARQPASPPDAEPARFALHNIELSDGRIHLQDDVLQQHHEIEALQIGLPFISNLASDVQVLVQPKLQARVDGSPLQLSAETRPFLPGRPARLQLSLRELALQPWVGLLKPVLPPSLAPRLASGTLDLALTVDFEAPHPPPANAAAAASASAAAPASASASAVPAAASATPRLLITGALALHRLDVALPGLGAELRWKALHLRELALAPLQQDFHVGAVDIDALDARYSHPASPPAKQTTPATSPSTPPSTPPPAGAASAPATRGEPATPAAAAPHWMVDLLRCRDCRVTLLDHAVQPTARFDLQPIELELRGLASDAAQPIDASLKARITSTLGATPQTAAGQSAVATAGAGSIELQGRLRRVPLALQAEVQVGAIDLAVLQPYIAPQVNLVLLGGKLGSRGQLTVTQEPAPAAAAAGTRAPDGTAPISLRYRGQLALDALRTQDRVTSEEFVRWQRLGFDALDLTLQGPALTLDLGRIHLDGLDARVILHPDGHLNLADVMRRGTQPAQTSLTTPQAAGSAKAVQPAEPASAALPSAAATAGAASAAGATELPQLGWQAIRISNSELRFSDFFIRPNYSARLSRLQGSVSALNTRATEPAQLDVTGALDDGAPLRIAGRLHPLGPRLYTDIEANARGIALPRLSTYAERYTGYGIEKGSLSATLRYRIDQGKLEADHQLTLDQLTFGDRVESPSATQLPVLLAVALLKDRHGVIDLHLPVAGTLDDPQFSVGAIVWKMVVNLVSKAITAPFALLFGDDREDAGQIDFAPGSAELSAPARDRLDALAARLADRPGIRLEATGSADALRDADALQRARQAAAAAAAAAAGAASAPQTARSAGAAAALPARPASVPAAASAPASVAAVTTAELQGLADERSARVMAYLADRLPAERILLNRSQVQESAASAAAPSAARVRLSLH